MNFRCGLYKTTVRAYMPKAMLSAALVLDTFIFENLSSIKVQSSEIVDTVDI